MTERVILIIFCFSFDADHILSGPAQINLTQYKGIQPPFNSRDDIEKICEEISVEWGDRL